MTSGTLKVSKQRLTEFLFSKGFDDVYLPKNFYYLPTKRWVEGPCLELLNTVHRVYEKSTWMCVDVARWAAAQVARRFADWSAGPKDGGFLFGVAALANSEVGHEVNVTILADDAGELVTIQFVEPETPARLIIVNPKARCKLDF